VCEVIAWHHNNKEGEGGGRLRYCSRWIDGLLKQGGLCGCFFSSFSFLSFFFFFLFSSSSFSGSALVWFAPPLARK